MAKVNWSPEEAEHFVDLCLEELNGGNGSNKTMSKKSWARIQIKWNAHYSKERELDKFKNKWDSLKKEWRDFEQLLNQETEIGWNPVMGTIDAKDEWWERQKQAKTKFFKYKIAPFTIYEKCKTLFSGFTATSGPMASTTPSRVMYEGNNTSMPAISHDLGDEGSGKSDEKDTEDLPVGDAPLVHDTPPVSGTPPVGCTPVIPATPTSVVPDPSRGTKRSRDKGKTIDASKLTNIAERMCSVHETKLSTSVNQRSYVPTVDNWSIEEVIDVMMTLPCLDPNGQFFSDCLVWMDTEHNRRTFLKIPTPEMKLNFLRSMMRKSGWDADGR